MGTALWPVRMVLANPAGICAIDALHTSTKLSHICANEDDIYFGTPDFVFTLNLPARNGGIFLFESNLAVNRLR